MIKRTSRKVRLTEPLRKALQEECGRRYTVEVREAIEAWAEARGHSLESRKKAVPISPDIGVNAELEWHEALRRAAKVEGLSYAQAVRNALGEWFGVETVKLGDA